MKRISLLVSLFFLVGLFALPTEAAKFKRLSLNKIADSGLARAAKRWKSLTRSASDTASAAVQILSKKESEPWEQTVKQVLWDEYTNDISAESTPKDAANIRALVEDLLEASSWFQDEEAREQVRRELPQLLSRALRANRHTLLFTGGIGGEFDGAYMHITVVDLKNQQVVSIYGGYSE